MNKKTRKNIFHLTLSWFGFVLLCAFEMASGNYGSKAEDGYMVVLAASLVATLIAFVYSKLNLKS